MNNKIIFLILIIFLSVSCSKKEIIVEKPIEKNKAMEIYQEALDAMKRNDFFFASKQFAEAETVLPEVEMSAKAAVMTNYCLYLINFYDDAISGLERFLIKYPADKNVIYAKYLLILSLYEQILPEEKDISPLLKSKVKINEFLKEYSESEYSLDLRFKLDLINNQLAAKEMYIAKYYIKTQKWVPAINRLKIIVKDYNETIFIEEALHRLVEIYYNIGLEDEARNTAILLGYNYNSSEWFEKSYKILNKEYKIQKKVSPKNKKSDGLIKRTISRILN
jgi:outer membrane protein assembly factor BamD